MNQQERIDGDNQGVGRTKWIAVLLAVLAGPFTWTYTFKKDKVKFWIGMPIVVITILILGISIIATNLDAYELFDDSISHETETGNYEFSDGGSETLSDGDIERYANAARNILIIGVLGIWPVFIWAIIDRLIKPKNWYKEYLD